eukprot:67343_1
MIATLLYFLILIPTSHSHTYTTQCTMTAGGKTGTDETNGCWACSDETADKVCTALGRKSTVVRKIKGASQKCNTKKHGEDNDGKELIHCRHANGWKPSVSNSDCGDSWGGSPVLTSKTYFAEWSSYRLEDRDSHWSRILNMGCVIPIGKDENPDDDEKQCAYFNDRTPVVKTPPEGYEGPPVSVFKQDAMVSKDEIAFSSVRLCDKRWKPSKDGTPGRGALEMAKEKAFGKAASKVGSGCIGSCGESKVCHCDKDIHECKASDPVPKGEYCDVPWAVYFPSSSKGEYHNEYKSSAETSGYNRRFHAIDSERLYSKGVESDESYQNGLMIGGLFGGTSVIILMFVFCIGLACGM